MKKQKKKLKRRKSLIGQCNRILSYLYVPLLFSFFAYGILYFMTSDFLKMAVNTVSLFMSDKEPEFNSTNYSVFVRNAVEVVKDDGGLKVSRSDVGIAEYGEMYGYVRCMEIALDAPIYKGDDDEILKKGIGQNFAASQPGFGRLVLLCGHNNTYFNALKNIGVNHMIEIETSYGTYTYKVRETKILSENDNSAYDFNVENEQLVMYTCYPFDMLSHTQYRFFVYADFISGPIFVES